MDTIEILKQCTVDGLIVRLPDIRLEREDYLAVKKKLELIGGKWKGGKVQGFEYKELPAEFLSQLQNGENRNLKKEYQFFATPGAIADRMAARLDIVAGVTILEPSAGQGALVKAINRAGGKDVFCYEAMPLNQTFLKKISTVNFLGEDFLQHDEGRKFDRICANPPFNKNQDIDHIRKMWACLEDGGRIVTVASVSWVTGTQKKQVEFRKWLDSIEPDMEEMDAGAFEESGTGVRTMLLTLDKPYKVKVQPEPFQAVNFMTAWRPAVKRKVNTTVNQLNLFTN